MRIYKFILLMVIPLMFSCQKDPMEDVNSGKWNKERNILSITLENQIGPATIVRNEGSQSVTAYVDSEGLNFESVGIESLVLSYEASSNVAEKGSLNFNNEDYRSQLTVTSKGGESIVWDLYILPYEWFFLDLWNISEQRIYVDQEWGSKFDRDMLEVSPNFYAEMDNKIEWTLEGFRNGKPYGTINNQAGEDDAYGSYKISDDVDLDLRLRHLLPIGESTWEMDLATNEVTIMQGSNVATAKVSKEEFGVRLDYELSYKNPYEPHWDYGSWDNYMAWSYRFVIDLKK